MIDVVIIGGGHAGLATGESCARAGLKVLIIDEQRDKPESWDGEWLRGRGVVSGPGLVAVLDPATADERRLVQAQAIVIAVGRLDRARPADQMLGITKLGAEILPTGQVVTDQKGRTRAEGIYAAGGCASSATPGIIDELVRFCDTSLKES